MRDVQRDVEGAPRARRQHAGGEEEAVQDAFAAAVRRWPATGPPPSPAGWIITTARNCAIDRLRREVSREGQHAQAALLHARDEPDGAPRAVRWLAHHDVLRSHATTARATCPGQPETVGGDIQARYDSASLVVVRRKAAVLAGCTAASGENEGVAMGRAGRMRLPSDVTLIPCVPPKPDQHGQPVGEVQLLFARAPDGTMVAYGYTSPEALAAAHGSMQPWVALRNGDLAEVLAREEVRFLVLDAASPDGIVVRGDGGRVPVGDFDWEQEQQDLER